MPPITRFEDIQAWQAARSLVLEIYKLTSSAPFSRDFSLLDQIRRSSGSTMHNIAEGFGSNSDKEFARFLGYSQRSCFEVQSQLYVALDQNYISEPQFKATYQAASDVSKLTGGFIKYLKTND